MLSTLYALEQSRSIHTLLRLQRVRSSSRVAILGTSAIICEYERAEIVYAKKAGPLSDGSNAFTAGDGFWNQTDDLKYNPAINYYCIDEWGSGSPAKATPATNNIVVGTSELFWSVLSLSS